MHLHTEIYPNLKSISELFKMYMKRSRFFCICITRLLSLVQPHTRLSPPLRRQSSFSSAASHQCLWDIAAARLAVIFFRHNRFAETHSHLQLSYHITDRLLVAGNKYYSLKLRYTLFICYNAANKWSSFGYKVFIKIVGTCYQRYNEIRL